MLSHNNPILTILAQHALKLGKTMSSQIAHAFGNDPFFILISCLLSLRAKDRMTLPVSLQLFKHIKNVYDLTQAQPEFIESIIHPLGFYKQKTKIIQHVAHELITRFNGAVPKTYADLISIKGVGPKTANLVLSVAYGIPAICVDIHVHRISNRLGLVHTTTPEQTQQELERLLPHDYWSLWNEWLVLWGQHICAPRSPQCTACPLAPHCAYGIKKIL